MLFCNVIWINNCENEFFFFVSFVVFFFQSGLLGLERNQRTGPHLGREPVLPLWNVLSLCPLFVAQLFRSRSHFHTHFFFFFFPSLHSLYPSIMSYRLVVVIWTESVALMWWFFSFSHPALVQWCMMGFLSSVWLIPVKRLGRMVETVGLVWGMFEFWLIFNTQFSPDDHVMATCCENGASISKTAGNRGGRSVLGVEDKGSGAWGCRGGCFCTWSGFGILSGRLDPN